MVLFEPGFAPEFSSGGTLSIERRDRLASFVGPLNSLGCQWLGLFLTAISRDP